MIGLTLRPAVAQLGQGDWVDRFVDLHGAEETILPEPVEQEIHDLGDRRRGAPEIEAGGLAEGVAQGRRGESNEELIRRHGCIGQAGAGRQLHLPIEDN